MPGHSVFEFASATLMGIYQQASDLFEDSGNAASTLRSDLMNEGHPQPV